MTVVELFQVLNIIFDAQGVGVVDFERNKGIDQLIERNIFILGDELLFETNLQICVKINNGEIDLSTTLEKIDDFLSRKKRGEISNVYDGPSFAQITLTQLILITFLKT